MIQESLPINLPEVKEIGTCTACFQGKVILETTIRNIPSMDGPSTLVATETCYCNGCGTCFHPTIRKKYEAARVHNKKPQAAPMVKGGFLFVF
jgi:hypothetical protein